MDDRPSPDKWRPKRVVRRLARPVVGFMTGTNAGGFMRHASRKTALPPVAQPEPQQAEAAQQPAPEQTGAALIAGMQAKPYREIELEIPRGPMPVRSIDL